MDYIINNIIKYQLILIKKNNTITNILIIMLIII